VNAVAACLLLYAAASVLDMALTYHMASLPGFYEANPYTRAILPYPHLVLAREVGFFLYLAAAAFGLRRLFKGRRAAGMTWLIPLAAAAVRWTAVIHNLLLLAGLPSPFTPLLQPPF